LDRPATAIDDTRSVSRDLGPLLALLSAQPVWRCGAQDEIASATLDVIQMVFSPELSALQLELAGKPACLTRPEGSPDAARLLREGVEPSGVGPLSQLSMVLPGDRGRVLVACRRSDFPSPRDEVIFQLIGEQAALSLQAARERQRCAALELESQRKDEFLATLGHELRNPLASVVVAIELLAGEVGGERGQRFLEVVERQTTNLNRIVDDLLDVARIARGTIELEPVAVDLVAVVDGAARAAAPLMERSRHRFEVDLRGGPVLVAGDRVRLEQMVVNLLVNAAKFTDPGGSIGLSLATRDGEAVIEVTDDGEGIEPAELSRIFDLFHQAPRAIRGGGGGLGIGLRVVAELARLHGGSVVARSDGPGRGSAFSIQLPLSPLVPLAAEHNEARGPERPVLVLIVDDDTDAADMLVAMLSQVGYQARAVYDGPAALEAVERDAPDAVILDIGLPGMDGVEVGRRLGKASAAPVRIALTGYGRTPEGGFGEAFDAHLVKPVSGAQIDQVLRELTRARGPGAAGLETES
jgi:signal transduction histidine kinase/ActR/RegA family two-component response regulator